MFLWAGWEPNSYSQLFLLQKNALSSRHSTNTFKTFTDWWIVWLPLPIRSLQKFKVLRKRMSPSLSPCHLPFPKRFTLGIFLQDMGQKLILQSNFCLASIINYNFMNTNHHIFWLNYKIFRFLTIQNFNKNPAMEN